MAQPKPYFLKYLIGSIFCTVMGIFLLRNTYKSKKEFLKVSGVVSFVSMSYLDLPIRDYSKYRYIKLDNYNKPFEIFVGKDRGDFKPELDRVDRILSGDSLTVYFTDENLTEKKGPVNSQVFFIDQGQLPVFVFSHSQRYLAWIIVLGSFILVIIVIRGRLRGKLI